MKTSLPIYPVQTPFPGRPRLSGILMDIYVAVACAAVFVAVGYGVRYRQDAPVLDRQQETIAALQRQLAPESLPQDTPPPLAVGN